MLQGDLVLRVFARDAGCCRVCLLQEGKTDRRFMVRRLDMSEPSKGQSMGDVALVCEVCEAIVSRWLALVSSETHKQNDKDEFGDVHLGVGA